ncbi:MAG TPA: hypothetical protein VM240_14875 [Verrucomicrobiae bacterium]|nr:hypothetical protein [Verrucomicrobiae bacterium]
MTLIAPTPAHLASVPLHERPDLPVTWWIPPETNGYQVLSRRKDLTWRFAPYIPQRNLMPSQTQIRFDVAMPDGKLLSHPDHRHLLNAAQDYLYTKWVRRAPATGRRPSALTLILADWPWLKVLLSWMIVSRVERFAALTMASLQEYVAHVNALEARAGFRRGQRVTSSSRRRCLVALEEMFLWRAELEDAPQVFFSDARDVSRAVGFKRRPRQTDAIPMEIAVPLVQGALEFVEQKADSLLKARDNVAAIRLECAHLSKSAQHNRCNDWLIGQGLPSLRDLQAELTHLRTANYIVIDCFSGIRDSEMSSLDLGCHEVRKDEDGDDIHWIKGLLYKLQGNPVAVEWLVPPIVSKAISVQERLATPLRASLEKQIASKQTLLCQLGISESERIHIGLRLSRQLKAQRALFLAKARSEFGEVCPLTNKDAGRGLRAFAKRISLPMMNGSPWRIHPHQFRPTYAQFVAHHHLGDLRALREHFKHCSIEETLFYAMPSKRDTELVRLVLDEYEDLKKAILRGWLASDRPLSGGRGRLISEASRTRPVKIFKSKSDMLESLGQGINPRGNGHTWCLASGPGCGGAGLYDAILCADCKDSVIDESHVPVWREIRAQQEQLLAVQDTGPAGEHRARKHLKICDQVLADLGST